jgi:uncharacterized protein (DUF2235 family)
MMGQTVRTRKNRPLGCPVPGRADRARGRRQRWWRGTSLAKRIVICLDGTWKKPETADGKSHPSNVLKFMRALQTADADGVPQVVFYDRGVGTGDVLDKYLGGLFGWGLSRTVMTAYRWLANNFERGDRLYFIGFSRGAYSARSLTGLVGAIGLMSKLEVGELPRAYAYYRTPPVARPSHPYRPNAAARRIPQIEFLGVFDTVGALGIPITVFSGFNRRFAFHDVTLGATVRNAFQALAVDERRKPFVPAIWTVPDGWDGVLEQVWFAGAHTNVGGGYADANLSDIALTWMIERAARCGLAFNDAYLEHFVLPEPRYRGWMGDEFKGFYRVLGPGVRAVTEEPARRLTVHPTVRRRWEDPQLGYRPGNLRDLAARLRWSGQRPGRDHTGPSAG